MAALGVATYHWLAWRDGLTVQSMGTFNVYLFFVLSALTMAMVYGSAFGEGISRSDAAKFFRNRAARIVPLLLLVTSVYALLQLRAGELSLARVTLTGSGLFGLALPGFLSNVTGAWSLGIELLFYAFVPAILLLLPDARKLAAIAAALIGAQQLYLAAIWAQQPFWNYYTVPLTFAPFFAIGLLIYRLGGARSPWFLMPVLAAMTLIGTFSLAVTVDLFRAPSAYLSLMAMCALTIYCANRTALPAILDKPAAVLGDASYSLYLTHPLTFALATRLGLGMAGFLLGSISIFIWSSSPSNVPRAAF